MVKCPKSHSELMQSRYWNTELFLQGSGYFGCIYIFKSILNTSALLFPSESRWLFLKILPGSLKIVMETSTHTATRGRFLPGFSPALTFQRAPPPPAPPTLRFNRTKGQSSHCSPSAGQPPPGKAFSALPEPLAMLSFLWSLMEGLE